MCNFKLSILIILLFFSFPLLAQENWQTLSDKGTEAFYASQFQTAVDYFKKAIQQAEKEFGKDHPNYVTSCTDLADTYRSLGLYAQAEPLYLASKKTIDATTREEHIYYTTNRLGLAELYRLQGKYDIAESLYLEAKNVDEKQLGKTHPDYAISCNNLAILYSEQGLYPQAEPLYIEAMKIREKAFGKNHPDYAASCNNLASLYLYQGLYAKAEALFLEAKDIIEKSLGKEHLDNAISYNNLASLYLYQGLYAKTKAMFLEAKTINEKNLGKENAEYAFSCNNLAALYYFQKLYVQAEPLYIEAKNIREKNLGKSHHLYAQSCNNLANLYSKQRLYAQAEALYIEAKNILEQVFGKKHPYYASSCYYLASLYQSQGQYAQAEPLYQEAIQNKLNQIQTLLPTLSETERKAYLQSIEVFFEDFYAFAATYYTVKPSIATDVFHLQLMLKGLLFQSTQKMQNQILKSNNQALIAQYKDWKTKRAYLSKLLQLSLEEKEKQGITPEIEKQLTTEANEIERQLSQSSELFTKAIDKKTYTWQDIQKQLKKGESLVEMIRISQGDTVSQIKYIALIITPQTQNYPQILLLENGNELENRYLNYYRNGIKFQKEDKYSYEQYLSRLKVETFKRVYFSPDGVYHQVNLLTLRNPKTGKYLADETDIRLISNPKDLITFAQKPIKQAKNFKNYQLHLFGFPQYSNDVEGLPADSLQKEKKRTLNLSGNRIESDSTVRFLGEGGKINLLPGTKTEVENIQKTAQIQNIKTQMYLRQDATEENINQLQNPDFLHIATHGFFLANLPEADEGERGFTGIETKKYIQNPLLRCGLLFAGAENSLTPNEKSNNTNNSSGNLGDEDGILTADEAMNLYLDKTDLVVLSACETGLGEISNGEGVYGLQRAFQQAGAKTVLMSLWTVSDEATQEIMSLFYQNLFTKKQDKRTAFRNAQKTLKNKYPQPYFWGAFVMVGE